MRKCCTAVVEMFTYLQTPSKRIPKFVFWPIIYFARGIQQSYKHLWIHIKSEAEITCVWYATSIAWHVLYSSRENIITPYKPEAEFRGDLRPLGSFTYELILWTLLIGIGIRKNICIYCSIDSLATLTLLHSKSHGRCQWCCLCTEAVSCCGGCVVQQYTKHVLRSMCVLVKYFVLQVCTAAVGMFAYL